MVRTQLLLEPEQHRALAEMARRADRSLSDVVREILRQALAEKEKEAQQPRAAAALQRLRQLREAAPAYAGNPIAAARIEREQQAEVVGFPDKEEQPGREPAFANSRGLATVKMTTEEIMALTRSDT